MKATGIIRKIDDLGRIVIPKEIRRRMNIREGDSMEIYLEDDKVIFQKYQTSSTPSDYIYQAIDLLKEQNNHPDFVDVLSVIAMSMNNP